MTYAVSGSFALAHWGIIRATVDVDVKVGLSLDATVSDPLRMSFRRRGLSSSNETTLEYRGVVVDLYPIEGRIDEEALERRQEVRLLQSTPRKFWIVTPEDLILSKLREFRRSSDSKHLEDIRRLIVARRADLDVHYLAERIVGYGFQDLWNEALPNRPDFQI